MTRGLLAVLAGATLACAPAARAQAVEAQEHALTQQGISGEIMDVAVEHCRRGEKQQALAMFSAIREQLDPPPQIESLIRDFEATGCDRAPLANNGVLRVQAGGGYDSNVSQGISARSLVLGSGDTTLELALDTSYRPRASGFAQLAADYSMTLPGLGVGLQVAAGTRQNFQAPDFDLATVSAAASREFVAGPGSLRAQLEVSQFWLGGHDYLASGAATAQWLVPSLSGAWLATARTGIARYRTQASQDARQVDLGILREQRVSAFASVHAGFSWQKDVALGLRPGGDRRGWQALVGGVFVHQEWGWRLKPELSYTRWNSAELFAPGLLDVPRRNSLKQILVQAEKPLGRDLSLLLEWRGRWANDTIVLYKYQAQVLSATLIRRF